MSAPRTAGFVDGFSAEVARFVNAVDWSQRWLLALGGYYVLALLLVLLFRRHMGVQMAALAGCLLQVLFAQPLNALAHKHWRVFATEDYFGTNGFFVSIVFGLPLLLLAIVALINLLLGTASLAVTVKRMELAAKRNNGDGAASTTATKLKSH